MLNTNSDGISSPTDLVDPEGDQPGDLGSDAAVRPAGSVRRLGAAVERGLTTVEYAIGIVLILAIVGVLILAVKEGWFMGLVQMLMKAIFDAILSAIGG
ncbi:MAG: hypothetical protein ACK5LS_10340 [Propioniciclava sp.]